MLGAMIGDIVGSIYEFHNHRSKEFELFNKDCFFTDDSVMTAAVASALIYNTDVVDSLKFYGKIYPTAGYGCSFRKWLFVGGRKPYYSYGNGSAMRVSSVGWMANAEKEVKKISKKVTAVTHNHPEGIKGAEATAMAIFMARKGHKKAEIKQRMLEYYPEIANMDYKQLVKSYRFNETCQNTVPQAIYCFLISDSFEDCLRTSVSIGGDTDTLCAISCAIAEAFYGIPENIKKGAMSYFTKRDKVALLEPINDIYKKCGLDNYIPL